MFGRQRERGAIAGREQLLLALVAAAPDRPHRVDDVSGLEAIAAGDLGGAGLAAAQRPALGQKLAARRAMNGAVNAAAAEQRPVGGVDDGIDVERGDVGDADLEPRGADMGAEQEGDAHTQYSSMEVAVGAEANQS